LRAYDSVFGFRVLSFRFREWSFEVRVQGSGLKGARSGLAGGGVGWDGRMHGLMGARIMRYNLYEKGIKSNF